MSTVQLWLRAQRSTMSIYYGNESEMKGLGHLYRYCTMPILYCTFFCWGLVGHIYLYWGGKFHSTAAACMKLKLYLSSNICINIFYILSLLFEMMKISFSAVRHTTYHGRTPQSIKCQVSEYTFILCLKWYNQMSLR